MIVAVMMVTGCRKAEQAPAQAANPSSDRYDVTLDTGGTATITAAPLDVTVRQDGKPVTDAEVAVEMRMPATPQMGEMRTGVELKAAGDGHYRGQVDLGMSGKWTAIVRVKRSGQVVATTTEPVTAAAAAN
jgi:hypothetical protein